ncbi:MULTISPECIES: precorrin-2 C(20)-methyltransferase [unclassified Nocardioides]|uniref:precorrin-2 C(20)-methyltransferase n=1 Tax=unclassified Nocardioides TaxID=2615069 RepID=UPI0009EFF212|nr:MULTISPECIES: precorrin-2 C(20)-methyltransferase [unclassified Nocardioides]GAW50469.1 precorrin-3 methyltransferase / precorrin-2 C20-methyltransferase [Nocardioides sp. PD653-B2]GAW53908.1 precorrin-3 methyltransferase / precorrin-2 C20-methyltransferase [Nocardioides sp. PD653]
MTGRFYGVGVGPGDPELVTLKAARLIAAADVVAYHSGVGKQSNARRIAASLIPAGAVEEELRYPVTTGTTSHPGGYAGAMVDFYEESAERLAVHLAAGRTVVLLAEGDPLFYGSYMYMHDRLSERFVTEVVAGVPAFAAAAATVASPLVRQTDVLTILPGTLPEPELARRLADTDGAIIMKLGRTFPAVRRALEAAGRLEHAVYVERASMPAERWLPVADVDPATVPYFSLIVVPGDTAGRDRRSTVWSQTATFPAENLRFGTKPQPCELLVVGLGPGPEEWVTPEVTAALAEVDHVVGYAPYVNRVPQRAGLTRHASGNSVELDRARLALGLALRGERVAVVSGGDAGVFGMAAAVFEAAEDPAYAGVAVRVLPGVSAVQAVAARAGAPIGADFAVISLSDRLKPWSVVEKRLVAIAQADLVLAIYNPASRSRTEQVVRAQKLLLEHRCADTAVVVGRDVGRAEESLTVTTLAELDAGAIDMKCLLIVGASSTRVSPTGAVWTPRSVG